MVRKGTKWTFSFKRNLLLNQWTNINTTSKEYYCGVSFKENRRCYALLQMSFTDKLFHLQFIPTIVQIFNYISSSICYYTSDISGYTKNLGCCCIRRPVTGVQTLELFSSESNYLIPRLFSRNVPLIDPLQMLFKQ